MPAATLAQVVGADSRGDPQFVADVQALYDAGTIRLMSFGGTGATDFLEAMLVPPQPPSDAPVD
jgi:hypothetical protein